MVLEGHSGIVIYIGLCMIYLVFLNTYITTSRISFTLLYLYEKVRKKGGWVVG